jgi:prephenate dehydrogenase
MFEQLGLIGCGMMGGSFALAMKRAGLVRRVIGYSKSPSTTQRALQMGVIDVEASSALLAASNSDVVMLAVPVSAMEASMKAIRHLINPNMLLLDVGSTKRDVVDAARRVLRDQVGVFVPSHPIAGKEASGVEAADPEIFVNRQVICTPIERTQMAQLKRAEDLWAAIGCSVVKMSPEAHDGAFAAVSHLPHMIAFALMNSIGAQENGEEFLKLAGPGFRDFSRIAASDPEMWRDVFMANRHEVLQQLRFFKRSIDTLAHMLDAENADALANIIAQASQMRSEWRMTGKI